MREADLRLSHKYMYSNMEQKVVEIERRLVIWRNKIFLLCIVMILAKGHNYHHRFIMKKMYF